MSSVCPYLFRDREGRFVCEVLGGRVDPGLMPCLANYRECQFYAERATIRAGPAAVMHPPVERPLPPEEVPTRAETQALERPLAEKGAEELEEKVIEELRTVEALAVQLNEKWASYEEGARRLVKMWEEVSMTGTHAVRALSEVASMYEKLLSNLKSLLDAGRISPAAYEELRREVESNLNDYRKRREDLEIALKNAERLVTPHIQRVKVSEAKPEIGKLRLGLMKLEQLFKEGKVSREVYERMKRELEERIKRLEQISGEAL
ncbi:MAG: hypothetical protein QXZ31_00915 [Thermofilaceae archaeon]